MDSNFWLERWAKHEIGFHQGRVNEYLLEYWPRLAVPNDATVFVPLCGKTLDMRWLSERGHRVLGIEIARTACAEFFAEWNVEPQVSQDGKFERWAAPDRGVTLLCGDFFDLQPNDLADVVAVFDRAALIALPQPMRKQYVAKLREILRPGTGILLVATDFEPPSTKGPPFAVEAREIRELFAGWKVDELATVDVTNVPEHARFLQRGLTRLIERVFHIEVGERA
jgi:thiopurine S-methyltransferase